MLLHAYCDCNTFRPSVKLLIDFDILTELQSLLLFLQNNMDAMKYLSIRKTFIFTGLFEPIKLGDSILTFNHILT